jgi:hypothetical protein
MHTVVRGWNEYTSSTPTLLMELFFTQAMVELERHTA